MTAPRQAREHGQGLVGELRFAQDRPIEYHGGVGGEHRGRANAEQRSTCLSLGQGQAAHVAARRLAAVPTFVHLDIEGLMRYAELSEK
jgi:hypothetical protein